MLTTRQKIALARLIQLPLMAVRRLVGKGPELTARRGGLRWRLDLREGIDFSIYLLGAFERATVNAYRALVRPGMTVLDVGANIGAHTLGLARQVGPNGRVIAVEPTEWAFRRLGGNLSLNTDLEARVVPVQAMLIDNDGVEVPEAIPSSWPLSPTDDVHPKLRGRAMATTGARAVTGDRLLAELGVGRIDFIKLDVDGFECRVLAGLAGTLERDCPVILMELSPYVLRERGDDVRRLLVLLRGPGYRLYRLSGGPALPDDPARLDGMVGDGAGFNVIAKVGA